MTSFQLPIVLVTLLRRRHDVDVHRILHRVIRNTGHLWHATTDLDVVIRQRRDGLSRAHIALQDRSVMHLLDRFHLMWIQ